MLQHIVFRLVKDGILQRERRSFAKLLQIIEYQGVERMRNDGMACAVKKENALHPRNGNRAYIIR